MKNIKKSTLQIFIITLIVVNVYLLYRLSILNNNKPVIDIEHVKVEQIIGISRVMDEISVINKNCLLIDEDSNEIIISDLLRLSPLLVLKISKLNCNTCVDQNIKTIKLFLKNHIIKKGKIIILYQDSNIRDLTLLSRALNNKVPIYRIKKEDSLKLRMDKLNIPYFFVLDSTFTPKIIHVRNDLFPSYSEKYLEIIFQKFLTRDCQKIDK